MKQYAATLRQGADLDGFRAAARRFLALDIPPDAIVWDEGVAGLFTEDEPERSAPPIMLPRAAGKLIQEIICHREPQRFGLLYRMMWRLTHGEKSLLDNPAEALTRRLEVLAKDIRRDLHKMHAFLRFRATTAADGAEHFVAWFEPDNYIVEATADFFVERFRSMVWSIFTPVGSLHWDRETLVVGPPGDKSALPETDDFEAGWRSYYESTFNPARVNPKVMKAEMATRYWKNLPEAQAIPGLIRGAESRVTAMVEKTAAAAVKRNPEKAVAAMADQAPQTLEALNAIIRSSPPLVPGATQAVLGEGPVGAAIAFVGEQPGDQEDLAGKPFVGPAGQLLDRAMEQAGIDRRNVYVTNAVKHFKFEQRGKRRIHSKPTAGEISHYRWWLMKELDFVAPKIVVALGATALQAMAGVALPLLKSRGERDFEGRHGFVTVHPSYLLRLPDEQAKEEAYAAFVQDMQRIHQLAA